MHAVRVNETVTAQVGDTLNMGREEQTALPALLVIPSPFEKTRPVTVGLSALYFTPDGITFPDGQEIVAFRVFSELHLSSPSEPNEPLRVYALRFAESLLIFAPEGEDATAAAMLATAQVDAGVPFDEGDESDDHRLYAGVKKGGE